MNPRDLLTSSILFLWLPIVVAIFASMPPRRAVVASFVIGWLALPNVQFVIPGIPNYSKMTATVFAVLMSMMLFESTRLFRFRPKWYDAPIVVWCISPFCSALSNDLGTYEGLSAVLEQVTNWGLPYLIGRLYLNDLESCRELALGIVVGALTYVPFCLLEMRMSQVMGVWVYGITSWEFGRFGGYRPKVFLATGLELGMWMTNATLIGYQIWACKAVRTIRGTSFGWLLAGLAVTTVLCKSTGALLLMVAGLGTLQMVRLTKRSWPIWLLLAIPPTYAVTRGFKIWSGAEAVELAKATVGADRAQSQEYRFQMEDQLTVHALERPLLGWGRFGRSLLSNAYGKVTTVQDGFWVMTLGTSGLVGLITLLTMMLLPMVLTIRRFPVASWSDPQIGPVVVLGLVLVLWMIDFLSNAMLNPIQAVAIGALVSQTPVKLSGGRRQGEAGLALASELLSEGHVPEATREFYRTAMLVADGEDIPGRQVHAEALDGLGHSFLALGKVEDAEHAFRDGLLVRDWLAANAPGANRFRDLAIAREGFARVLVEAGRPTEAVQERLIALGIWEILNTEHPRDVDYRTHRVDAMNDLAWMLSTDPDPAVRDAPLALNLAEGAVRISGDHLASWNTLGVARYRSGDWAGAIEALERSALSSLDGLGTAFDHYFLAMAWCRLQHHDQAREWLERGQAWATRHRPGHPTLERCRNEAESLLKRESGTTPRRI